jgi:hypothetical protein
MLPVIDTTLLLSLIKMVIVSGPFGGYFTWCYRILESFHASHKPGRFQFDRSSMSALAENMLQSPFHSKSGT